MGDKVEITIASDTRWLALIRRVTEEFCRQSGLEGQEIQSITLAVGEAVSNVIKHSYKGDRTKELVLVCRAVESGIEILIRDEGEPFDPDAHAIRPPDEIRPGGRGLYLMRTIMDSVEYRRDGSVNSLILRKLSKTPVKN